MRRAQATAVATLLAGAALAAAGPGPAAPQPRAYGDRPSVAALTALGRAMFDDPALSASGRVSCASCHDPVAAFGPTARTPSPFRDDDPDHDGTRAIPSLRYAQFAGRFTEHTIDDEETHGADGGPTGGLTWDGRADTAREQALMPLFDAREMANADAASLARRVAAAPYAAQFRAAFSPPGGDVFADPSQVVGWMALAFEVFEQAPEFAPFDSRYDRWLAGRATLGEAALRGLALYRDPAKGNCDTCHPSRRSTSGRAPLFTDAGFIALAAPRRTDLPPLAPSSSASQPIASLARGAQDDLGLCRSGRPGLSEDPSFCGRFRTPTLRNVALRASFFHNGSLHSLRDAVAFYATRDTDPARWYARDADGGVHRYDDLPADAVPFVDREIPFAPRPDGRPRLDERDIDDIVAFLRTLTDADMETPAAGAAGVAR
ncbi:MAG: cytochrome-c peroxidase [Burkholderiales bacterium]|nr:cytochrome-c peroxidase [Burkholderiales bacterium]